MTTDEEHREFDRTIAELEEQAEEREALLRRIQIELELFVDEEVSAHPVNHLD